MSPMRKTDVPFYLTEMVTLLTPFILLIMLHFCHALCKWLDLCTEGTSLSALLLAHSLSVSPVVSSLPLFLCHT